MPCCAFAAVLFGQLILFVAALERRLLGAEAAERNPAVEWQLGAAAAPVARRPRRRAIRGLALAAAVETAIVVAGLWALSAHSDHAAHGAAGAAGADVHAHAHH